MLLTTIATDLIHDILLLLDSRRTLAAFISANRLLYEVFKANPNSILRQVVCNEIDMDIRVFPYALASLKSQDAVDNPELMDFNIESQSSLDYLTVVLTPYSFMALRDAHYAVYEMAKYYSIRFKEGKVLRNILTTEESRRFHIAAHLVTNYQAIWHGFQGYGSKEYNCNVDGEDEADEAVLLQDAKTISACHSFLTSVSTDELLWMREFRDFLLQDIDYVLNLENDPKFLDRLPSNKNSAKWSKNFWRHFLLSTSVGYFNKWNIAFFKTRFFPTHLQRTELWLTDAISRVLRERGVGNQTKNNSASDILDSKSKKGMLTRDCQKCGRDARHLFNQSNLDDFIDTGNAFLFPRGMTNNSVENARAHKRFLGTETPPFGRIRVMSKLLPVAREIMKHGEAQLASGSGHVVTCESDGTTTNTVANGYNWVPDDLLCRGCFTATFSGFYYAWWLEERRTKRVEAHKFAGGQCMWGEECVLQGEPEHAALKDHCCPPTEEALSRGVFPWRQSSRVV